jgi:hypothetical protein
MIRSKIGDQPTEVTGTAQERFLALVLHSTYLYPSAQDSWGWMILVAALTLCIPFFLMSVWVEYLAAEYLRDKVGKNALLKWAWLANSCSYGLIMLGLIATAIVSTVFK